jgi:hypothetical protein
MPLVFFPTFLPLRIDMRSFRRGPSHKLYQNQRESEQHRADHHGARDDAPDVVFVMKL